ncbi:unnamed protein product, partial [marine sediment metagenome]
TDGENGAWVGHFVREPFGTDVEIETPSGASKFEPAGSYYFAFLDDDPNALYGHNVRFVYIDEQTGETVEEQEDWVPTMNGDGFFVADFKLAKVYAPRNPDFLNSGNETKGASKADPPSGDYGDAPDDSQAYRRDAVTGLFPTSYDTSNSVDGRPGGHALNTGEEMIGTGVSAEKGASDGSDPDGKENLVNGDADEKVYAVLYPDYENDSVTIRFHMKISVAAG